MLVPIYPLIRMCGIDILEKENIYVVEIQHFIGDLCFMTCWHKVLFNVAIKFLCFDPIQCLCTGCHIER